MKQICSKVDALYVHRRQMYFFFFRLANLNFFTFLPTFPPFIHAES
jgi:hypothetical protein